MQGEHSTGGRAQAGVWGVDVRGVAGYSVDVRGAGRWAIAAVVLFASSCGADGLEPSTAEEARDLHLERFVIVSPARPSPWCRFIGAISAMGDDPASLRRPAVDVGANYVLYAGDEPRLVSCGVHCSKMVEAQLGYGFYCPPMLPPPQGGWVAPYGAPPPPPPAPPGPGPMPPAQSTGQPPLPSSPPPPPPPSP